MSMQQTTTMEAAKKSRSGNWEDSEVEILVDAVSENAGWINQKFSSSVTSGDKARFWADTTEKINAVGGKGRSKCQVCKKWQDLKRSAKKKEVSNRKEQQKTGGGTVEVPSNSAYHEKIIQTIPTCCIDGLPGEDTSCNNETEETSTDGRSFSERTDEERFFASAIEKTIKKTTSTSASDNVDTENEEKSQPKRKKSRKSSDEVSDIIMSLEMEQLDQLKQINKALLLLNQNISSLLEMKKREEMNTDILTLMGNNP